jgi:two-component system, OmpR family, sensor histidine kinase KdpD
MPIRSRRRTWAGAGLAVIGLGALTLGLVAARSGIALTSVALLYLVPVVVVAGVGGVRLGVAAAIASDLLLNWFFVPPLHTLTVDRRDNVIALLVYVLVAVTVAVAVDLAARERAGAAARTLETIRHAEQAAELAEVDRVRTAILASVGHDLRTPLASIKAAASSLRAADVDFSAEDRDELLATVEESTDRMNDLVENLLAMSRLQAGVLSMELRPVGLDEVVARALLYVTHPGVAVSVADRLPLVMADPGLLERVIANLIGNAVKAAAGGPVEVHGVPAGDAVALAIIDHGTGIAEADRDRVFAPFQRLDDRHADGGLGLGLAIARGFTTAMSGTLTLTETDGGGLTATVQLPIARS